MNKNIRKSSGACFSPVLNEANQPIRGLSRRRDLFYARLNLPDLHGRKVQRRITLKAKTVVQAQAELEALRSQRLLPQKQMTTPYWADYWPIYISEIKTLQHLKLDFNTFEEIL